MVRTAYNFAYRSPRSTHWSNAMLVMSLVQLATLRTASSRKGAASGSTESYPATLEYSTLPVPCNQFPVCLDRGQVDEAHPSCRHIWPPLHGLLACPFEWHVPVVCRNHSSSRTAMAMAQGRVLPAVICCCEGHTTGSYIVSRHHTETWSSRSYLAEVGVSFQMLQSMHRGGAG